MKEIIYNEDKIKDSDISNAIIRARGLLINSNHEILMCYSNGLSHYEFPGGHLEVGETLIEGLKRELLEETGIEFDDLDNIKPFVTIKYYCKNYHNTGKNTLVEIDYFVINTDLKYDMNKTSFSEDEIKNRYECVYVKVNDLRQILTNNKETTKENNSALDDMLIVWDEYLKNYNY